MTSSSPDPRESELALLRNAVRIAGVGGWELDPAARTLTWTDPVFRIHEVDRRTFSPTPESALEFFTPDSRRLLEAAYERALRDGLGWDLELSLITGRGRVIRVRSLGEAGQIDRRGLRLTGTFEDVSAAHAARELAQAREMDQRRLALVAQHTNDALIITDEADRIEWVNRRFVEITGYTLAEAIGRTPRELLSPADAGTVAPAGKAANAPHARIELKLFRRDGSPYWAEVDVLPVVDQAGRTRQFIHVQRDISRRKESQAQKAVLLERFEMIGSSAGIGYAERDFDTGIGYWDAQCFRLHGLPPGPHAPTRETVEAMVVAEDRDRFRQNFLSLRTGAAALGSEFRLRRADGPIVWIHLRAWAQLGADGQPARAVAILMDVTDRKRAEVRNLELSRRLALATRAAGIAIWEHDLRTDQAHWNEQTYSLYGLDPAAPAPSREQWRERLVHPEDRAQQQAAAEATIRRGEPYDLEHRIVRSDGSVRWVHSRASVLRDAEGRAERVLGATTDITQRKAAEQQLRATLARLHLASAGSGVGIFERALNQDDAYWSEECFHLYGLPPSSRPPTWSELLGRVHPDDRQMFTRQWDELKQSEQFVDSEFRIVRADLPAGRQERWLLTRGRLDAGSDGRPARVVGVAIDITERKRAELQSRELGEWLKLTAETVGMGTWRRTLATGAVEWDAALKRLFGMPADGPTPTLPQYLAMIDPGDHDQVLAIRATVPAAGRPDEFAYAIRRADGEVRHLLARRATQFDRSGTPTHIHGVAIDITELRQTQQTLRAAHDRLSLATAASRIASWERDLSTGAGKWDPPMFGFYGLPPDAGVPSMAEVSRLIHPDDVARFREGLERASRSPLAHEWEYRVVQPNGAIVHLLTRAQAQFGDDGSARRLVGVTLDVSEMRRTSEQLREALARLRIATEAGDVGTYERNLVTGVARWDATMYRLWGLDANTPTPSLEQAIAMVVPEDRAIVRTALRRMTAEQTTEYEFRIRRGDGSIATLDFRGRVENGHDGTPLRVVGASTDVTANREAQRALAAASERLALATRTAGVGIWEWSPVTGQEVWDTRMREIYGIADRNWQPNLENWRGLVHADDRERAARPYTVDLEHLTGGESEHRIVRPNGEVRTVLGSFVVERDSQGAPVRVLGTDLDITEARRAQSERDALSLRVDLMASAVGIGVWEWDVASRQSHWNDQMYTLFGRTREQFSNHIWLDAVHDDDRERAHADLQAALREGAIFKSQFRVIRPDGSVRWIASRGQVERSPEGEPLRMVGVNWDVTDLFRADVERAQLHERINMAATGAGIGFWHYVVETRTPYADDQTLALYGRTREQDPEAARHWLRCVHGDDRARMAAIAERLTQSDEPVEAEFRAVLPDGSVRHLAVRARRSIAADGRGAVVLGLNWDVTEQRMAESAVRARETAERANAAKTEFLSRMSHELRTPLNAILGFAQILDIDTKHPLDASQRERLMHIQKAGWHLLALINEILDLSRIEAGKAQLAMSAVPLADLIDECVSLMSADAARRRIAVDHAAGAGDPTHAWADRVRVKQIVLNLLSNAIKYNREGGTVRIKVSAPDPDRVTIGVRDSGPGLSAAQLDKIFQPFNRLGLETSTIEGTGIGLTISHKLAEQMGGALDVSSEVGVGSEFRVTLQAVGAPPPARSAHAASHRARTDVAGSVLYVEDNPASVSMVQDLLSLRPAVRLFTAADGAAARVLAAVCQPDLALLDLRLPDTDGISLITELHAISASRAVPCVAVSANGSAEDIVAARRAGFVDFWPKPIDVDQWLAGIDHWLTRQHTAAK